MHHRHYFVWTDSNRDVGFSRNASEQTSAAVVHAVHVRHSMLAVHVVHDVEVTHLITGSATGEKKEDGTSITNTSASLIQNGLVLTLWYLILSECHISHVFFFFFTDCLYTHLEREHSIITIKEERAFMLFIQYKDSPGSI